MQFVLPGRIASPPLVRSQEIEVGYFHQLDRLTVAGARDHG